MFIANLLFVISSTIISIGLNYNDHRWIFVKSLPAQLKIGCLLHENQYEQEIVFRWTIDQINRRQMFKRTRLVGLIRNVEPGDSFDAGQKACELLAEGAIAIIGPPDDQAAPHVASICDSLDVPHFNVITKKLEFVSQSQTLQSTGGYHDYFGSNQNNSSVPAKIYSNNKNNIDNSRGFVPTTPASIMETRNTGIDMSIRRSVLYEAYLDLVMQAIKWRQFVYVYEQDDSLYYLQQLLLQKGIRTSDINMRIVKLDPTEPYRNTFWSLRSSKARLIMLDVECPHLQTVLEHAQQVSMMTEAHGYLIVCLDTQTLNLESFKYSRTQIVWMNAIDLENAQLEAMSDEHFQRSNPSILIESASFRLIPERLRVESARIHDAVMTIVYALNNVDSSKYFDNQAGQVSCNQAPKKSWPDESTIMNYIKASVDFKGMTGQVRFDPSGYRSNYNLNILRLTEQGPITIGNWSQSSEQRIRIASWDEAQELRRDDKSFLDSSERRDLLIVVSIINDPFFMNKQTTKVETGNSRYEGYAVDLIDELSRIVGFDYVFKEVDDGKYGKFDEKTREWNGMIREVMIGKADLAIADLSITSSREDAVDFTLPFMNTGISVLFKKPTTKELEFFSFLSPFEGHVWFYVVGAYVSVSVLLFIVGRVSPYEWTDPHPCRREDRILRNQFSLVNSFWFTMAAVMQQGSDLAPKSLSTRLVAAIWYFFTLIMISSYTANLAAFLTVEKVVYPIEKAEDLYKHPQHIKYGCLESGSTQTFFQSSRPDSTFRRMHDEMVLVKSNDQGKAEVEKGNYAYFMESISIEYTIERQCNLTQIGGLLDSKGYGIAIAKNSTRQRDYRTKLSEAILSLQENGILQVLKNRWWKEKRGGGACDDDGQSNENVKELTLENVGGVFAIVLLGITVGFVLLAQELYKKSSRLAAAQGSTKWAQLKRRIQFAMDLNENY